MPMYTQNCFTPLLDAFNTERPPFAPWFDKMEIYRLEYWERHRHIRSLPPFESDHEHRFWEIHLFTDGEQMYTIDNEDFPMQAGELLMIPPLAQHRQRVSENGVAKFALMLHAPKDLPAPYGALLQQIEKKKYFRFSYNDTLLSPLQYLFTNGDVQPPRGLAVLTACMFLFLDALFAQLQVLLPDTDTTAVQEQHGDTLLPDNVIDYIENHISRIVTVEEVAQHFFISTRHLNRRLTASCGLTFHALSDRIRSEFAGQLLQHTDLSVENIGERVGFSDAGSFARFFKRTVGMPPSVFRKTKEMHGHEQTRTYL